MHLTSIKRFLPLWPEGYARTASRFTRRAFVLVAPWLVIAHVLPAGAATNNINSRNGLWVTAAVRAPRVEFRTFDSSTAKTKVSYHIYTPEVYDTDKDRRFPVLYWLHGTGGGAAGIAPLSALFDRAIRYGKIPPILVVFPNGMTESMWCNSKDGTVPMETVVVKELIPEVDAAFRTVASREGRLIEGFSMGGYGAVRLGFKYPEIFGAVSILAGGPLDLDFQGPRASANPSERDRIFQNVFGGDLDYFRTQSPWMLADQHAERIRKGPRVRVAVGDRDFTAGLNRALADHLKELGIPHSYAAIPEIGHNAQALLNGLGETNWEFYRTAFGENTRAIATTGVRPERHSNFIIILGEGSGWTSTSVQMDDRNPASKGNGVRTPNLERLAAAGMRFSDGYAASPRCTPSRAALFTGRSPAALHMTFVNEGKRDSAGEANGRAITPNASTELAAAETTIGELLKRAGYATAHFGKWHVGRVSPSQHGFDESDGATGNGGPDNVSSPNPKQALAMTAKGVNFMERQVKAGKPFYLQLSHYPNQAEKGGGERPPKSSDDETVIVDQTLGQLLDAVERLGLKGNTYIVYTTDHGTPGRNPPLTGGKGTVWEGGLRVPFIVAGPGVKSGTCSHVRVSATDLFPTFAELAGVPEPLPAGIEGGSFSGVLKNGGVGAVKRSLEEFVVHFPHYDKDAQGPASAIYVGDLKLIHVYETSALKLFNIASDPGERRDLASKMPEKVKELDVRLMTYLKTMNAQLPKVNPNYDPNKPSETKRPGGKRKGKQ